MALLFTVLCGAAVLILGYFSYYFYRGHFIHGTENLIDTEIRHAVFWDEQGRIEEILSGADRVFLLLDAQEEKLAGNIGKLPKNVSLLAEGTIIFDWQDKKYAAKIHTFPDGRKLLAGTDISQVAADYRFMQWLSILSIIFMIIVIATSYMISAFVVTRTNSIARTAKKIMDTGDLSERIDVDSRWDDLSYMAAVINEFLDRMQNLMLGIRQVSDNIAHDLRTPLTRIRGNIEALKKQKSVAKDPEAIGNCDALMNEANQLLGTFNALLRISRIETGRQHSEFSPVELSALAQDAVDLYEPLAEEKRIALNVNLSPAELNCDRDLLFQALANILDNAIKFTPEGGNVSLTLEKGKDKICFCVIDSGPGIPESDREKVFERFYRRESSRHAPGSGLGLSLVAAVVDLHGGTIALSDAEPGLSVCVHL